MWCNNKNNNNNNSGKASYFKQTRIHVALNDNGELEVSGMMQFKTKRWWHDAEPTLGDWLSKHLFVEGIGKKKEKVMTLERIGHDANDVGKLLQKLMESCTSRTKLSEILSLTGKYTE